MNSTCTRRAIATRLLHSASVGAGAAAAFTAAGRSTATFVALVTAIGVSGLIALAREWFWLSALRRPTRNLYRIHELTGRKIGETERLMGLIQEGENNVLTARAAATASNCNNKHQQR
jgi:hypothetical protein